MKKNIEIAVFKCDDKIEVEGINDEWYTICQIPHTLISEDELIEYNKNNRIPLFREWEIKYLEWEYQINWKKLIIYRKEIEIEIK